MPKSSLTHQYRHTTGTPTPYKPPKRGFFKFIAIVAGVFILLWAILGGALGKTKPASVSTGTPTLTQTVEPTNTSIPTSTIPANPTISVPGLSTYSCVNQSALREQATLVRITDGDTIVVMLNGQEYKVRYIGMDSPEIGSKYAQEASDYNAKLLASGELVMIKDTSETDRYDRLLRYVFSDGKFVNYEMVKAGLAKSGSWPPDTSCDLPFSFAQSSAKTNKLGLWLIPAAVAVVAPNTPLPVVEPAPTSAPVANSGCPNGCTQSSAACLIKGNISAEGEKIYHMPGQAYYDKTVISPEKGERWFCTESEAVNNGWRKAKR